MIVNFELKNIKKVSVLLSEDLQSEIIQFKTNYLTKKDIYRQAKALKRTLYTLNKSMKNIFIIPAKGVEVRVFLIKT
ncbi:hypothetical protein CM15mP35_01540 [bacterium]|nr:MAG: hypothetical protein CM15mP35_01540 [bacterium]